MLGIKRIVGDIVGSEPEGTPQETSTGSNTAIGDKVDEQVSSESSENALKSESEKIEQGLEESRGQAQQSQAGGETSVAGGNVTEGNVTETTDHAAEVVNTTLHSHTTEEVERQRNVERHEHVVNVVEQPLKQEDHLAEDVHENVQPTTEIEEKKPATEEDKQALAGISKEFEHKGDTKTGTDELTVVDKGEKVNETVHTHVQNVVVPVVEKDVHEHHRVKTVVPTHQVVHEAPVVQKAGSLEPMSREDYLKSEDTKPTITSLQDPSILPQDKYERNVSEQDGEVSQS